jgi:uncharacterized protein (DUF1330 family)
MGTENQFPTRPEMADGRKTTNLSDAPQKGYLIAHIDVSDLRRYALYADVDEDAFTRYGGRFIVRGGEQHSLVGKLKTRTIVVEFESLQVAMDCYNSLENQSAKSIRLAFATADAVMVEGHSDP